MRYAVTLAGKTCYIVLEEHADGPKFLVDGEAFTPTVSQKGNKIAVKVGEQSETFTFLDGSVVHDNQPLDLVVSRAKPQVIRAGGKSRRKSGQIKPPMPGKVVEVHVAEGDQVAEGSALLVLEAMKMQNDLKSPIAGIVKSVKVKAGQNVEAATIMIEIEATDAT